MEETRPRIRQRFELDIQSGGALDYVEGFGEDDAGERDVMTGSSSSPTGTGGAVRKRIKA